MRTVSKTLTENAVLIYAHSTPFKPEAELGINHSDPEISIKWPLETSLVSQRDKHLPSFEEFKKNLERSITCCVEIANQTCQNLFLDLGNQPLSNAY